MLPFSLWPHKKEITHQEVIAVSPDERVILFKNIVQARVMIAGQSQAAGLTVEELFLSGETIAGDYVLIAINADDAVCTDYGDDQNLTLPEAVAAGQHNINHQNFLEDLENRIFEAHIALED